MKAKLAKIDIPQNPVVYIESNGLQKLKKNLKGKKEVITYWDEESKTLKVKI